MKKLIIIKYMKNLVVSANILFCIFSLEVQSQTNYFIKNMGQWENNILYLANGEGYKLIIAKNGIYLNHQIVKNMPVINKADIEKIHSNNSYLLSSADIKMSFLNSNIIHSINNKDITPKDSLDFTVNYINYGDEGRWVYDVPVFKSLNLNNIYEGINLNFYYDGKNIRYDFVLNKNVRPEIIELKYEGCENIAIENNEIKLTTKLGIIYNGKIKSFIDTKLNAVNTNLILENNTVRFNLDEINNSGLIIDPLLYATFYEGDLGKTNMYYGNAIRHNDEYFIYHSSFFDDFKFTDTLYHPDTIFIKEPGAISVFDKELKKVKRIYIGTPLISIDENYNLISEIRLAPEMKSKYNCFHYKDDSCITYITKVNLLTKKITNAIGYEEPSLPFKYETDNNGKLFIIGVGASKFLTTNNAYSQLCQHNFKNNLPDSLCNNGCVSIFNKNLDSVIFASFIPYTTLCFDICFDNEESFYITGQLSVKDMKSMLIDEIIDEQNDVNYTIGTFVIKFDKNFRKVKAVGIYNAKFYQIEYSKNGEIILGGNLFTSYYPVKYGCLNFKTNFNNNMEQVALMALDKDLKYQRSCIIDAGDGASNNLGHANADQPNNFGAMKLDETGNVYYTGSIAGGKEYPIVNETNFRTGVYFGDNDISLTKISSDFTKILYSTVYGGEMPEYSYYMDIQDSIITIIGETGSADLKMTPDALQPVKKNPPINNIYSNSLFFARFNTGTTDIEDEQTNNAFIYPNPTDNKINLNETLVQKYNSYQIYDIMGRMIRSDNLISWQINISDLSQGAYYLRLLNNSSIKVIGFIKK